MEPTLFVAYRAAEMGKWIDNSEFNSASRQSRSRSRLSVTSQAPGDPIPFQSLPDDTDAAVTLNQPNLVPGKDTFI
jgi:hypothetical protein